MNCHDAHDEGTKLMIDLLDICLLFNISPVWLDYWTISHICFGFM
jgi:hypothetical protein